MGLTDFLLRLKPPGSRECLMMFIIGGSLLGFHLYQKSPGHVEQMLGERGPRRKEDHELTWVDTFPHKVDYYIANRDKLENRPSFPLLGAHRRDADTPRDN